MSKGVLRGALDRTGATMKKIPSRDIPELTDEELAFEMIEITCDEMESLTRAFEMISDLCADLTEEVKHELATSPGSRQVH